MAAADGRLRRHPPGHRHDAPRDHPPRSRRVLCVSQQLRRPELRGLPVIVGGAPAGDGTAQLNRGVVSAASYEARAFGVHSAMPLRTALHLCPQAVLVPVDFRAYRDASKTIFDIARDYTPVIEPLSLDEAFLDVTASTRRFGPSREIAEEIRDADPEHDESPRVVRGRDLQDDRQDRVGPPQTARLRRRGTRRRGRVSRSIAAPAAARGSDRRRSAR